MVRENLVSDRKSRMGKLHNLTLRLMDVVPPDSSLPSNARLSLPCLRWGGDRESKQLEDEAGSKNQAVNRIWA